jgi:DNA-binding transcriptional regulator GbsR (MarR family)
MEQKRAQIQDYLERWGMVFEQLGGARMMGKVLAWLLICDPPEQTAREIADAVGASAGSVSTTTRGLVNAFMIERIGKPGHRSAYFRVRPGMWVALLKRRMAVGRVMGQLAAEGQHLVGAGQEPLRLKEIESYCNYIESKLPAFIEKWEREWEEEKSP